MPKKLKIVKQKQLYDLVLKWYECHKAEREAMHKLASVIPFKPYHNSGAMSLMFDVLYGKDDSTKAKIKGVSNEMTRLINNYSSDFLLRKGTRDLKELDKIDDDELYN